MRATSPAASSRSIALVTLAGCTCRRSPMRDNGNWPLREKSSSISTSNRENVNPNGASVASTRASRIWWARMTDVTSAMPVAASPHPALRQLRTASPMGSKGKG